MDNGYSLKVKECKIYFVYSFIVTYDGLIPDKGIYELMFKHIGKPDDRIGLSTYLALDLTSGWERFTAITGKVDNCNIQIIPLIRYFPSGCSITLEISVKAPEGQHLEDQFVYELQHLTSIERNDIAKKKINLDRTILIKRKKTIYDFTDTIKALARKDIKSSKREITIFKIAKYIIDHKFQEWEKNKKLKGEIHIICRDKLLETVRESQTPWVVTVLQIDEKCDAYKTFCGSYEGTINERNDQKIRAMQKYENILAPILYRAPDEGLKWDSEPTFNVNPDPMDNHLKNLYLLSSLFIQMSRRSIILITGNIEKRPASYIIPTILDIAEMTHTRWQNLIMMNLSLDDTIKKISYDNLNVKKKFDDIISIINNASQCLEDPLIYNVSGNVLREITTELRDTYRIKELEQYVIKKIDLLEKVNDYAVKRDTYDKYFKEPEPL